MAGLGRRSQYRKHLTDSVIHDLPEPGENQCIAKVVATRGGNQFDILTAAEPNIPQLAILPTKFHKLVWVKRNDYVIVQGGSSGGDDDEETTTTIAGDDTTTMTTTRKRTTGVRFMIERILYKEQIKHLRKKKLWPKEFDNVNEDDHDQQQEQDNDYGHDEEEFSRDYQVEDDGIVYNQGYDMDEALVGNTNRSAKPKLEDSSEDESDNE